MDFLSLSLNYWEDLWQSRHQIMAEIARNHKVLFVSPPFSFAEVIADRRKKQLPSSGLVHRGKGLYTLVFPKWMFETYDYPRLERWMTYLRTREIRRALRDLGFRETVLLIWHPYFANMVGAFGEVVTCYYVDDEFASYSGMTEQDRQKTRHLENSLLSRADRVFVNGKALMEIKNRYGNAINVPMTADFGLFATSRSPETVVPPDLEAVPHPRVGYIGNVNDKVDFSLLARIAANRPQYNIVLIGPVNLRTERGRTDFDQLRSLPNIYLFGSKPRETLPRYIKGLDVCLLCYAMDGWAYYIYPLKLHEYLASGKPIVGSPLVSLLEFEGLIRIARSERQWLESIDAALLDRDGVLSERRVQVAYDNRLEERVRLIVESLEQSLEKKKVSLRQA